MSVQLRVRKYQTKQLKLINNIMSLFLICYFNCLTVLTVCLEQQKDKKIICLPPCYNSNFFLCFFFVFKEKICCWYPHTTPHKLGWKFPILDGCKMYSISICFNRKMWWEILICIAVWEDWNRRHFQKMKISEKNNALWLLETYPDRKHCILCKQ